jgi:hypothetical protein
VTAGHGGDVPDLDGPAAGVGDVRLELGEVLHDRVVQVQQAFGLGESGRRRGEALAQRVQQVPLARAVRRPPAFGHHVPVPHDHQAVQLDVRPGFERVQHGEDGGRVDVLVGRRAAWQGRRHAREPSPG